MITKQDWIKQLELEPHPFEGGYYRQTYVSSFGCVCAAVPTMDVIYYMLTDDSPFGWLHRNTSDIVHFYHAGAPLDYVLVYPSGDVDQFRLGPDVGAGDLLQLVVPAGVWKGTQLRSGEFGLVSEAVTPAFDPAGRIIATKADLRSVNQCDLTAFLAP